MKLKIAIILTALLASALIATLAYATSSLSEYDTNRDNRISRSEAVAGIEDYFDGEISREEAVDIFLAHYAEEVLAPHSTPIPRPTAVSTPESTPIPATHAGMLDNCYTPRSDGRVSKYAMRAVETMSRHVEVAFINPDRDKWDYGFFFNEDNILSSSGGDIDAKGLLLYVSHTGYWSAVEYYAFSYSHNNVSQKYLDYGKVPSFNAGAGEKNHVTVLVPMPSNNHYWFYVNGEKVAEIDYKGYEKFREGRATYIFSYSGNTRDNYWTSYEGLCTQDSWTYTR